MSRVVAVDQPDWKVGLSLIVTGWSGGLEWSKVKFNPQNVGTACCEISNIFDLSLTGHLGLRFDFHPHCYCGLCFVMPYKQCIAQCFLHL